MNGMLLKEILKNTRYRLMKLKIILGVLAIGILLGISNQDFIFSVLANVIHKYYFADYAEFDYEITYCP